MLIANGRQAATRFLDTFDLADYENTYHRTLTGTAPVTVEPQLVGASA
jgi:hypothetical protein